MASERLVTLISVAYLGYGRHGACHRRQFDGGHKNCLAKWKSLFTVSLTSILRPCIHELQSCINAASSPRALRRACWARTTKHYDKFTILWHNKRSDIATEQERSLAMSTRPRPSHAIRKDKLVRTAAFQASRYLSEAGWDQFKSVAVRICLLCK